MQALSMLEYSLDDELAMHLASPARINHRRVRSDPSDIIQSIRAERRALEAGDNLLMGVGMGGAGTLGAAHEVHEGAMGKRGFSNDEPTGFSPAVKKQASVGLDAILPAGGLPLDLGDAQEVPPAAAVSSSDPLDEALESSFGALVPPALGAIPSISEEGEPTEGAAGEEGDKKPFNKKDVPMWTVEEDLLILKLVEQHGKRWSKIASNLPGRTDNGVRNRWNRMERAQVLRKARGPAAGYRCRRCGEPKRGHICAARTTGDQPEGEDLHMKAAALTELSAHAMSTVAASTGELPELTADGVAAEGSLGALGVSSETLDGGASPGSAEEKARRRKLAAVAATPAPSTGAAACSTAARVSGLGIASTPFNAAVAAVDGFATSTNVDDFLDELRRALDDTSVNKEATREESTLMTSLCQLSSEPPPQTPAAHHPAATAPLSSCPFASAMAISADPPSLLTLGGPAAPSSVQPPSTLHEALAGLATDSLRTLEPRMQSSPSGDTTTITGAQLVF